MQGERILDEWRVATVAAWRVPCGRLWTVRAAAYYCLDARLMRACKTAASNTVPVQAIVLPTPNRALTEPGKRGDGDGGCGHPSPSIKHRRA